MTASRDRGSSTALSQAYATAARRSTYNVPAGYALLTPRSSRTPSSPRRFFARLRFIFYAAAALPPALWDRIRTIAADVADHPAPLTASWGATETAPAATCAHFDSATCGCIGVPIPGVAIKLVPEATRSRSG